MNNIEIIEQLRKALAPIDALSADLLGRRSARVDLVRASFLNRWQIYRVDYFSPSKPILFYVGANLPDKAFLLTNHPNEFRTMVLDEPVQISDQRIAIEYFQTFIETTRSTNQAHYFINSVSEVDFMTVSAESAKKQIEAIHHKYSSEIAPLCASDRADGIEVVGYAIVGRDLVKYVALINPSGIIKLNPLRLETDLPVTYRM